MIANQLQDIQGGELGLPDTSHPPGYRLVSQLGVGGFSTVFQAIQESTGQLVALKRLRPDVELDEHRRQRQLERFERETQLCAELSHPHIVKLLDKGRSEDGQRFAVFEYVPGETLKAFLARRGPLSALEAGELMGQVLDALASAHARGIVHRDLKPQNIMVSSTGAQVHVKVLDFGIGAWVPAHRQVNDTTLTLTREMIGTPSYSAPEQLRGEPPTVKSDLYAWGLVFLECLTGKPAVRGQTLAEIYHHQLSPVDVPLPPPIARHELANLLRRVLRKDPRDRAEQAAQVYVDLHQINLGSLEGIGPISNSAVEAGDQIEETWPSYGSGRTCHRERRQITVLGCNSSLQIDGNAEPCSDAIELLEALQGDQLRLMSDIASIYGGRVAGELGGSVMIYFGYPYMSDADTRWAAKAALELIDQMRRCTTQLAGELCAQLTLRLGMHTGMVLARPERRSAGLTPNIALRLGHLASPGTVLVSETSRQLLEHDFEFEPLKPCIEGRGLMPIPAFTLTGERCEVVV